MYSENICAYAKKLYNDVTVRDSEIVERKKQNSPIIRAVNGIEQAILFIEERWKRFVDWDRMVNLITKEEKVAMDKAATTVLASTKEVRESEVSTNLYHINKFYQSLISDLLIKIVFKKNSYMVFTKKSSLLKVFVYIRIRLFHASYIKMLFKRCEYVIYSLLTKYCRSKKDDITKISRSVTQDSTEYSRTLKSYMREISSSERIHCIIDAVEKLADEVRKDLLPRCSDELIGRSFIATSKLLRLESLSFRRMPPPKAFPLLQPGHGHNISFYKMGDISEPEEWVEEVTSRRPLVGRSPPGARPSFQGFRSNNVSPELSVSTVAVSSYGPPKRLFADCGSEFTRSLDDIAGNSFTRLAKTECTKRTSHVKFFSVYIDCNPESESTLWSCDAIVEFRLLSQKPDIPHFSRQFTNKFNFNSNNWGFPSFMEWGDILNSEKGYIKGDRVVVEARITVQKVVGVRKNPRFDFLTQEPYTSDTVLIIDGVKLHVSKTYLSLYSPVFYALFFSKFSEREKKEIPVEDVILEEFIELLNVVYPSHKPISTDNVEFLLELGDKFEIQFVIDECERFLISSEDIAIVTKLVWADQYCLAKLQITSLELVEAYIHRIEQVNGIINAVVVKNFEQARQTARDVDMRVADMDDIEVEQLISSKPLLGVPFTMKDALEVEGIVITCGIYDRRQTKCEKTAEVVQRMVDAGGILLAITNVPEVCMWVESSNTIYGRTSNPYDARRQAGGSSGGEGALIGAAGSVVLSLLVATFLWLQNTRLKCFELDQCADLQKIYPFSSNR
uniref:MATH domain-containing protein n=1 Tax=Heterorhabditis bacteriophora TaxID=37862 RepID=A0A1I7XHI6_HETBA